MSSLHSEYLLGIYWRETVICVGCRSVSCAQVKTCGIQVNANNLCPSNWTCLISASESQAPCVSILCKQYRACHYIYEYLKYNSSQEDLENIGPMMSQQFIIFTLPHSFLYQYVSHIKIVIRCSQITENLSLCCH